MELKMTPDEQTSLVRKSVNTPQAAAIAGILFALLYGISLLLVRSTFPSDQAVDATWLDTHSKPISLALNLVPYAGIAFLWFIGVIRDRLGDREDRFIATVFLGSGLLFLAMIFAGAALAGGLLTSFESVKEDLFTSGVYSFSRASMYNLINIYSLRMSSVFMISLGSLWLRTGLMKRGWTFVTYILGLVLLLSVSNSLWVALIFPAWVLAVSVYFLIMNLIGHPQDVTRPA
jgi:hypothetical protein